MIIPQNSMACSTDCVSSKHREMLGDTVLTIMSITACNYFSTVTIVNLFNIVIASTSEIQHLKLMYLIGWIQPMFPYQTALGAGTVSLFQIETSSANYM
jgi:hypothetical protein